MDNSVIAHRAPVDIAREYEHFITGFEHDAATISEYRRWLGMYLKIAEEGQLLDRGTKMFKALYPRNGWTFQLSLMLTENDKLSFAVRRQGNNMELSHELAASRPVVRVVWLHQAGLYMMYRPQALKEAPPEEFSEADMTDDYAGILRLALLQTHAETLVPKHPGDLLRSRHWRSTTRACPRSHGLGVICKCGTIAA